jgi:shikimate kinase
MSLELQLRPADRNQPQYRLARDEFSTAPAIYNPLGFALGMNKVAQQRAEGQAEVRQKLSRLILTGFMGAGKSTVGAILARDLGWRFFDLDDVIEASSQLTVAEIFRDHGEASFRQRERQAVKQLSHEEKIVLALGGGTVEDESTRTLLVDSPGNCLVFLEAKLPELLARCTREGEGGKGGAGEGKVRPLLADPEALEARHKRRLPHYQSAHVTVVTTDLPPRGVANQVLELVGKQWLIEERRL